MAELTPMQRQYQEMKQQYPDCMLLFRMGDFYETFYEDAETAARILGITLTGRGKDENRIPMAGIPYHALGNYLPKLLKAGIKVAIAEQMSEPGVSKLVERKIVKVYTGGTTIDEKTLEPGSNNYLVSLYQLKNEIGVAFCDLSTGELRFFTSISDSQVKNEISRLAPSEIITPENQTENFKFNGYSIQPRPISDFGNVLQTLANQFQVANLKGFGLKEDSPAANALAGLIKYLIECQKTELTHIKTVSAYNPNDYMPLDNATIRNLELVFSTAGNDKYTLLGILDACKSPMGKRKLRNWALHPLIDSERINSRLNSVEVLFNNLVVNDQLREALREVYDIERIMGRIGLASANGRDLLSLSKSLRQAEVINEILNNLDIEGDIGQCRLQELREKLNSISACRKVVETIEKSIHPDAPITITTGGVINSGFNQQVDELRSLAYGSKQILAEIQAREIGRTGISALKIGFNNVFGYYLEVSKSNVDKVPADYIRKQTLANGERYITEELKELETKILNAESQLYKLEYDLFCQVRSEIATFANEILKIADAIAEIDVLSNFAYLARQYRYTKPSVIDNEGECRLQVSNSRHPVVERIVQSKFTPNNVLLSIEKKIIILTGPNMSGKSTYIRQIALITLMAQVGSFVPADKMEFNIVDRIFTRVGAMDNLSLGESTFMVEMNETANILNNATEKSLIILDEVGRGTSTYDGVAIAWSIVEFIHDKIKARTLFATHYHELIQLDKVLKNVTNYKVQVDDTAGEIVFTHHITTGSTDRSYGIHVAKLAGVPEEVIDKARNILEKFEAGSASEKPKKSRVPRPKQIHPEQLGLV